MTYLHVNVDSVYSWDAVVEPDAVTTNDVAIEGDMGGFSVFVIKVFNQAPVLNDALRHGNLKKNQIYLCDFQIDISL